MRSSDDSSTHSRTVLEGDAAWNGAGAMTPLTDGSDAFHRALIPAVTGHQMAEIDRLMRDDFGVEPMQLMEVAGRAVASFARQRFFNGDARGRRVTILCGSGGNGGDGLVAARYLHAWGALSDVWLGREPSPGHGFAAHQLAAVERLGIPVHPPTLTPMLPETDLLIDGLLGFSLTGAPTGETSALIEVANAQAAPILAIDLPSGLDATAGTVFAPCIRATVTLTLALPKTGLLHANARAVTGDLVVADIGVPAAAYARIGLAVAPLFAGDEFLTVPPSGL